MGKICWRCRIGDERFLVKTSVKLMKDYQNHWVRISEQAISKCLKELEMIEKELYWVPHELKPRDVERHLFACEVLLKRQTRNGFLHRIVNEDEKWVHFNNLKRSRKSWGLPGGHTATSIPWPNTYSSKVMLCLWWDQLGVIYYGF
nr:transposase [Hymenolepis microstoma]